MGKLLKRAPKPALAAEQMLDVNQMLPSGAAMPQASSGSIFNKNFILGAVTGMVIGAFVLPMILEQFTGKKPSQVQAHASTITEFDPNAPAIEQGETFLDKAIETNKRP